MKKLLGILLGLLIIYSIYFDLTIGTLPHVGSEKAEAIVKTESTLTYFEAKVKPGETLITIVENHANKSISIPINDLINDFESLNPGQSPEKIQIGKTYRFPKYEK